MNIKRTAFTITEVVITCIILAVALAVCVRFLGEAALQRRAMRNRQVVLYETANLMEQLCAKAYRDLTPEGVAGVQLSKELLLALPKAKLQVKVFESAEEPNGKRISVEISWPDLPDLPEGPYLSHQLVAWKYRASEE